MVIVKKSLNIGIRYKILLPKFQVSYFIYITVLVEITYEKCSTAFFITVNHLILNNLFNSVNTNNNLNVPSVIHKMLVFNYFDS